MSDISVTPPASRRPVFARPALGDERLAALVAQGDQRAFATIYSRYHQRLYRYCRALTRNDADAQDALQSTFASAFTALRDDRRSAPLRPWLFRIAHNEAISLLRQRPVEADLDAVAEVADTSVEERAQQRGDVALLMSDLAALPESQRSALVMRELSGLSHEEIALTLGVSSGAAKQTIFEARKSLMEFAAGREVDCEEIRQTVSDGDGRALRARRVRGHLRSCTGCGLFAEQMKQRSSTLKAIAPPLPAAAATALLGRVLGTGAGHGGGLGTGAGVAAKAASVTLANKALVGTAIVLSAGATVGVAHHELSSRHRPVADVRVAHHAPSAGTVTHATHAAAASGHAPLILTGASGHTGAVTRRVRPAGPGKRAMEAHRPAGLKPGGAPGHAGTPPGLAVGHAARAGTAKAKVARAKPAHASAVAKVKPLKAKVARPANPARAVTPPKVKPSTPTKELKAAKPPKVKAAHPVKVPPVTAAQAHGKPAKP